MPRIETIEMQIARFCVIYGRQIDAEEIPLLVEEWAGACDGMSDEAFLAACEETKKTARYFPIPQQVIAANDMRQRRSMEEQKSTYIPPEQKARNRIYAAVMKLRVAGKITKAEADPVFDRRVVGTPASLQAGAQILKRFGLEVQA